MRVVDLSQPLSRESQLHPFFPPTQILRHIQHTDAEEGRPSFNAEIIITSNHAATHVDAFGHYQKGGTAIAAMPLDTFCGEAICVDIRDYPGGHDVSAAEVENQKNGMVLSGLGVVEADVNEIAVGNQQILAGAEAILLSMKEAVRGAQQVAAVAEEAGSASAQAAAAARQQARGAEDLAAAIEEIASLAEDIQRRNG